MTGVKAEKQKEAPPFHKAEKLKLNLETIKERQHIIQDFL